MRRRLQGAKRLTSHATNDDSRLAERDEGPALGEVLPERGEAGGGVIGRVEGRGERGQHQQAKVTRGRPSRGPTPPPSSRSHPRRP